MFADIIVKALGGPSLVKLALALVAGMLFLSLRRKETEGILSRYAFLCLFLLVRDVSFAIFPEPDLYRISDLVVFGILAYVAVGSRGGWALRAAIAAEIVGAVLIAAKDIFGFAVNFPSEILRYVALAPIIVAAALATGSGGEETPGRKVVARMNLPLTLFSFAYLLAGSILGIGSFWFQGIMVPLCYSCLIWLAFGFLGIVEGELVRAVSYYEESVDSLYELLLPASQASTGGLAMQESLDNMARVAADRTGAGGSAILLVEEFEEAITVRAVNGRFAPPFKLPDSLPKNEERVAAYLRHARFKLGEGLLGSAAGTGKPLLVADAALDSRVPRNGEEDWLRILSLMVVPLVVRDRVIGVLALERSSGEPFTENDFDRAKLLASFGSIAIANSFAFLEAAERSDIEREAAIAEGIQKSLAPAKLPPLGDFAFGALTLSARGVCSDYYDIIQTRPDRAILAVGDIAGKGVAAGIVMVMVSSILHLITNSTKDMATLMSWVNRGITGHMELDHFATLGLVAVDAASGTLEFANAAHPPLLVYRTDSDAVETVDMKSIPVGVERATTYAGKRLRLASGDVLVMYTDGLLEAMNEQGKQFGRKNLASAIQKHHDLPPKEMAEAVIGEVQDFSGHSRQHDDQTILVMKAKL